MGKAGGAEMGLAETLNLAAGKKEQPPVHMLSKKCINKDPLLS